LYKEFYGSGIKIRFFPEEKTIFLFPDSKNKNNFLKVKSKLETLLQIDGAKKGGNFISLKISDNFNASVEELLKSVGLTGGIEVDDASSMVDDAKKMEVDEEEDKNPMNSTQQNQPNIQSQPNIPESFSLKVYNFLFEDFFDFSKKKARRKSKRYGNYWKPLEAIAGKNRNAIKPEDILEIRKKFAKKVKSSDRDAVLNSLDKAASYFYSFIKRTRSEVDAKDFDEKYTEIDSLRPDDYEIDADDQNAIMQHQNFLQEPDFGEIDYEDIDVENL
jgi:hypothetical protein